MSRVAVCLLFIAIFQNGIIYSSQEDNTPTEAVTDTLNDDANITTEVPLRTQADDNESKKVNDETLAESKNGKDTTKEPEEPKEMQNKEDEKAGIIEPIKSNTKLPQQIVSSGAEVTGKILVPIKNVRGRLGDAVTTSVNGAKNVANGAFDFFRDAVTSFLN